MGNSESIEGRRPAIPQSEEESAVLSAASKGNTQLLRSLVQARSNVNIVDRDGWSPLMLACSEGHAETAVVLLAAGADVNAVSQSSDGATALHLALSNSEQDILPLVGYLVEEAHARLDIKTRDAHRWTPLQFAAHLGHAKVVRYLISKGADLDVIDMDGHSVADIARNAERWNVCRLLTGNNDSAQSAHGTGESSGDVDRGDLHLNTLGQGDGHDVMAPLIAARPEPPPKDASPDHGNSSPIIGEGSERTEDPVDRFKSILTSELIALDIGNLKESELRRLQDFLDDVHGELRTQIEKASEKWDRELDAL